jgi:hypothetical protein
MGALSALPRRSIFGIVACMVEPERPPGRITNPRPNACQFDANHELSPIDQTQHV